MRLRGLWPVLVAALVAGRAAAQDQPAAPPPVLRLVPSPGKPVGFKLHAESSSDATVRGDKAGATKLSTYEMTLAVDVGAAGAGGALPVKLRIARISGTSTRLGMGSFDFDSEAAPPEDVMTRSSAFQFTSLAGAEFALTVGPDGSVSKVEGIDAAKKLAASRSGGDPLLSMQIDSWVSDESVRRLFLSLLGPAPFPAAALTMKSAWTDTDTLALDSWETTYEISRSVHPSAIAKDTVKLGGRGAVKLASTMNIALMPLQMGKSLTTSETSDWTFSLRDGLPVAGSETITMEGGLSAGKDSVSSKHRATFTVTRLAAPPPLAVRPLTGSQDADRLRDKHAEEERASQLARQAARVRDGTRGAWGAADNGVVVAAGTPTGSVEVWRTDEPRPIAVLKGHTTLVTSIAFAELGDFVYACAEDGTVRGWNVKTGKQSVLLGKPNETVLMGGVISPAGYRSVSSSPDGRYIGFVDTQVSVWDGSQGAYVKGGPRALFPRALLFYDSHRVIVSGHDELTLFDLEGAITRKPSATGGEERVSREPTWVRRRPLFAKGEDDPDDLGRGYLVDAALLDRSGLVITLMLPEASADRNAKSALQAWDVNTGAKRWEIPTAARRIVPARDAQAILVDDGTAISFLSPKDGSLVRTLAPATPPRVPRIFAADASAWFDADRDGNLVRVPVEK